jgi:hypothetical protein
MNPNLWIGVTWGVLAVVVGAGLLYDLLVYVYKLGYMQGREESIKWWAEAGSDVEQERQEIKDEEKWP